MTTTDPRTTRNTADPSGDQLEDRGESLAKSGDPEDAAVPNALIAAIWWLMLVLTGFLILYVGLDPLRGR